MFRSSYFVLCVLLIVSDCKGAISDKRLCGDPTCSDAVSYAKTLIRYASDDDRILSFQGNVEVKVFSKSAGSRLDLWGVEINGKRGYAPKDFIREYKILKGKLDHIVSTRDEEASSQGETPKLPDVIDTRQDSQVNEHSDKKEELPPVEPNVGTSAEQIEKDIPSSSETFEPYEVADGTTIYYSTDVPAEPLPILATTTESNIQPSTIQPQPDAASNTGNIDEPNPSMVLPKAATSTDAGTEKEDMEGSAEKIYNYFLSNFLPEQGSGEKVKDSEVSTENELIGENVDVKGEVKEESPAFSGESSHESEEIFIESTESGHDVKEIHDDSSPSPLDIELQVDGILEHHEVSTLTPDADIDILEKTTHHKSVDEEDEDGESGEEDEVEDEGEDEESSESNESSPESIQENPDSNSSLPPPEKPDSVDVLETQDSNIDDHKSDIEIDSKLEMPNIGEPGADTVIDGTGEPSRVETVTESHSKVFGSLEQQADHLNQAINESHLELTEDVENDTKMTIDPDITEGNDTIQASNGSLPDKEPQVHNSGDGPSIEPEDETVLQHSPEINVPNSEHTRNLSFIEIDSNQNVDSMAAESAVDEQNLHKSSDTGLDSNHNPLLVKISSMEQNLDNTISKLTDDQAILLNENNLSKSYDSEQAIDASAQDQTLPTPGMKIDSENEVGDMITDQNTLNELNYAHSKPDLEASSVELDKILPESGVMETKGFDIVADNSKDSLTTSSLTEDSIESIAVDDWSKDPPLDDDTEDPDILNEHISEDTAEDNAETSGGFFSRIGTSLFGSFFSGSDSELSAEPSTSEDVENSIEIDKDEAVEDTNVKKVEDGAWNPVWSSIWSSNKQRDNMMANHQPDTSSSCSADSGIDPDCDKVLLPGKEPRVALDNDAAKQQTTAQQDPEILQMDDWEPGGSYDMLSYLCITAVSMIVIILGHWFIEKMRCDSTFIKRINDLERALLYAELESKNLKIELEDTRDKMSGLEDADKLALLEEQLLTALDNNASLEETNASLEEKNVGLQASLDVATEAGLELNRMLSDILSTNKGSESLILSVNDLQQQLNTQQATINNMNTVLKSKESESEVLRNNLSLARDTIQSLEQELNQLTESLNEVLFEKNTLEDNFKSVKVGLEAQIKAVSSKEDIMSKEIDMLRFNIVQMESDMNTQEIEMVLLREFIRQLKKDGTDWTHEFKQLFDVAKAEAACRALLEERNRLADELEGEKDARKLLADHIDVTTKEVDMLREAAKQSEKEKCEAVTKHAVLSAYFQDKESQLQKELGYRDALYIQTKGDATSTHEAVKSLHEQLDSYKSQIDTLKKEIVDQERGLKSQILAFEKKSHENWLAARQAERKLQESKQEAALLRNRLTVVEKNVSNVVQNDKVPISNDRDLLDVNLGSPISPPLYPLDMNATLGDTTSPFVARPQPVASSEPPLHGLLSPVNHLPEEVNYRNRSNHASPSLNRSQPAPRSLPRKSPANPCDITFTVEEACDPLSPFFGILSPSAPYDPFHGRPIQDRHNPDLYHIVPLLPYITGPPPLMLPPPVLPNLAATHDRRPPPLGRMSSPPAGGRTTPPLPRGRKSSPPRGRLTSPLKRSTPPPHGNTSPLDRRHRRSSPNRGPIQFPPQSPRGHGYHSPERRHHRSSPPRGRLDSPSPPRGRVTPTRRGSMGSTALDHTSPGERSASQERGRRKSSPPRGRASPFDHSNSRGRTPSPERGRPYHTSPRRRRSPSPSGRYSDSSADSTPESRRYARRYDYSPDSSYRGRSRTPSPTSFRPISRQTSNNQGSNRSSNQSYESDESNRRGGRL